MGEIKKFPIRNILVEKIRKDLINLKEEINFRYEKGNKNLTENDVIGKKLYDGIMEKALCDNWIPYDQIEEYLHKINYISHADSLDEDLDNLYIASEKIGYTILVDQLKNTILNLTDEFSYSLLRAFLEEEVSYTQYKNYALILTDDRVVEKLKQLSGKTLFRDIQSLIAFIGPIYDTEIQIVYVIKELEEKIKHENQKTLISLLREKDSFTISELLSALSEQIRNVTEFYYNKLKHSKIIAPDFSSRRGMK